MSATNMDPTLYELRVVAPKALHRIEEDKALLVQILARAADEIDRLKQTCDSVEIAHWKAEAKKWKKHHQEEFQTSNMLERERLAEKTRADQWKKCAEGLSQSLRLNHQYPRIGNFRMHEKSLALFDQLSQAS
jgi:hypothetical protein